MSQRPKPLPSIEYPRRVQLAHTPTPLQALPRASRKWGRGKRLWIKRDDLTGSTLSGNKVRKLEFIAAHAQDQGYDTLITCGGIQSNHCRATAFVGAQLGLKVHLLLRGKAPEDPDGNYLLDQLAGAQISCYGTRDYFRDIDALFTQWQDHYAAAGHKALAVPTGGSDGLGVWGYVRACEELKQDFNEHGITQAHLVSATGSGGTQAGLTAGAALHGLPATVWGVAVSDDEQYFMRKVDEDIDDWRRRYPQAPVFDYQTRVIDGYVAPGYGRANPEVFTLIAELAALEGIVLDPVYTGKAFQAMLQEIAAGRFESADDIVFVHTGGLFGLFPQRQALPQGAPADQH
ncbi:MAG: D-cysteine desulfhydrase family protein [Pseudomonadota bacterium]